MHPQRLPQRGSAAFRRGGGGAPVGAAVGGVVLPPPPPATDAGLPPPPQFVPPPQPPQQHQHPPPPPGSTFQAPPPPPPSSVGPGAQQHNIASPGRSLRGGGSAVRGRGGGMNFRSPRSGGMPAHGSSGGNGIASPRGVRGGGGGGGLGALMGGGDFQSELNKKLGLPPVSAVASPPPQHQQQQLPHAAAAAGAPPPPAFLGSAPPPPPAAGGGGFVVPPPPPSDAPAPGQFVGQPPPPPPQQQHQQQPQRVRSPPLPGGTGSPPLSSSSPHPESEPGLIPRQHYRGPPLDDLLTVLPTDCVNLAKGGPVGSISLMQVDVGSSLTMFSGILCGGLGVGTGIVYRSPMFFALGTLTGAAYGLASYEIKHARSAVEHGRGYRDAMATSTVIGSGLLLRTWRLRHPSLLLGSAAAFASVAFYAYSARSVLMENQKRIRDNEKL